MSKPLCLHRRPEVEAITGLKKSRIDELERAGKFPARVRISDRAVGWRSDELDAWIAARPRGADVPAAQEPRKRKTQPSATAPGASAGRESPAPSSAR
jgi:prophage regulatory protein